MKSEGPLAFYRGFLITLMGNVPSQMAYLATIEFIRHQFKQFSPFGNKSGNFHIENHQYLTKLIKDVYGYFIAGGLASFVSITMTVPIDIITQRLVVQDQQIHRSQYKRYSSGMSK